MKLPRVVKPAACASLLAIASAVSAGVPDWLKQLDSVPVPQQDEEIDAVHLLDDMQITFVADGSQRIVERHAFRILRRGGKGYGTVTVHYDKDGKVLRMKGWSLPPQGKPFDVDLKDAIETALVPGTEGALITSARMKVMSIPASNPGNLIGYEVEYTKRPAIVGKDWLPQDQIPVLRARYAIKLPPGWNFSAAWFNGPAAAPTSPGAGEWQWELKDLTAVKSEANMPERSLIARHMHLAIQAPEPAHSSFRDWNEMGRWFGSLVAARSDVTAEISQLAAARTAGVTTQWEKIRALSEAVQKDVRYVEVVLDATGYQPRAPHEVLKTGYGDCKDKANYLRLLLEQIGVQSRMVLVNTQRGVVRVDSPPDAIFDHAVLAIRLPPNTPAATKNDLALLDDGVGGTWLLFDPTDDLTPFGRVGEHLRTGELLLVGEDGARLVHAPATTATDSGVDRYVAMKLAADGSLSGDVRESWRGVWANYERGRMSGSDFDADLKRPVEKRLAAYVANYQIQSAAVADRNEISKPFEWRYSFSARDYAKVAGELLMVRARVVGSKTDSFLETGEARTNPVAFDATHVDTDIMRVELPSGYEVESLPEAVDLDIGFAAYRSRTHMEGRTLVYERVFEQKQLDLPLERAGALRDFYNAINRDERSLAVLKKQGTH